MNCPSCPECVTYIPACETKLRPVNKTISEGQTAQRSCPSGNKRRFSNKRTQTHKNHLRRDEKLGCTRVSPVQAAFQPVYAE